MSHLDTLSFIEKNHLLRQISSLDKDLIRRQRRLLRHPQKTPHYNYFLEKAPFEKDLSFLSQKGFDLMTQGKVGCIVLAGGRGSRLDPYKPKGMTAISLVKNKSLFQLICEKTRAASELCQYKLPLAFMLSPHNFRATLRYFHENEFFGLDRDQISFFIQQIAPLLDEKGNFFLENPYTIAMDSLGNGSLPSAFVKSGTLALWEQAGITAINIIPVDNPLALPFDAILTGYHHREDADVTIKAVPSLEEGKESVGVLAKDDRHRTIIVDYSDLAPHSIHTPSALVNTGMYCISLSFLKASSQFPLALHKTLRSTPYKSSASTLPCWKFEYFLFDLFAFTEKTNTLVYSRNDCFAPLKNASGPASITSVREALMTYEKKLVDNLLGKTHLINEVLEVDADFYYPSSQIVENWQNKVFFLNACT